MANSLSPTAANIISSLGIKGATVSEALPGYVPVLGPYGKLNADFIPADAAQMALPSLSDAAFIDPNTTVASALRKGSIAAPYKTLAEAADNFRPSASSQNIKTVAFILAPGMYDDDGDGEIAFGEGWNEAYPGNGNPSRVYVIGLGACRFARDLIVSGMDTAAAGQYVVFQNLNMESHNVTVLGNAEVTLLGRTYIGGTLSAGSVGSGDVRIPSNVSKIKMSADSYVGSPYATSLEYLADSSRIGDTSAVRGSATVKEALDRLNARKIRLAKIQGSGSGISAGSSYDVSAESSGGVDVYALGARDRAIVSAIRDLYSRFSDISAHSVTAETITVTGSLNARTLSIDALMLGSHRIEIDTYGYLVVSEGGGSDASPDGAKVLMDIGDGSLWLLGVYNGRLFVERYYDDESSSSYGGHGEYPTSIDLFDLGEEYQVQISNGKMFITRVAS